MRRSFRAAPALAFLFAALPALAQPSHCDAPGTVDPAILERPTVLREGVGRISQKVTTSSPEAQSFSDQGLAYLHSYVWIEAARSFRQALRADPGCAMAWLGLARAEQGMERRKEAREALERARALAPKATDLERRFIALRAIQMDAVDAESPELEASRHAEYKREIEAAIAAYPDDAELWILRGNAEEPGPWGRGQRGGVGSIAFYRTALVCSPGHFGAEHYLVHSYENVGRHREAADFGKRYAEAAPRVAHAQHMYAHVLPRLGRWEEARMQLEKADAIERRYAEEERLRPGDDWHHVHNLQLLAYTYLRLGRVEETEKTLRRAYETPIRSRAFDWQHASLPEFLILRGRIEESLAASRRVASGSPGARAAGSAVEAEALLALGRTEEATRASRRASDALAEARKLLSGADRLYIDRMAEPFVRLASAEVDLAGNNPAAGQKAILEMADAIAADPRFDAWGEGLFKLERVAAAARRLGRPELAAEVEARMRRIDADYAPGSRSAPVRRAGGAAPAAADTRR
jgi:tetratricopeptide (TPR) repeat protein